MPHILLWQEFKEKSNFCMTHPVTLFATNWSTHYISRASV